MLTVFSADHGFMNTLNTAAVVVSRRAALTRRIPAMQSMRLAEKKFGVRNCDAAHGGGWTLDYTHRCQGLNRERWNLHGACAARSARHRLRLHAASSNAATCRRIASRLLSQRALVRPSAVDIMVITKAVPATFQSVGKPRQSVIARHTVRYDTNVPLMIHRPKWVKGETALHAITPRLSMLLPTLASAECSVMVVLPCAARNKVLSRYTGDPLGAAGGFSQAAAAA